MNAPLSNLFFVPAFLLVAACSASASPPRVSPRGAAAACETMEERCARGGCETFDTVAARARKPAPGSLYRYAIGTCGDYRFVSTQEGAGSGLEYFKADGTLVASTSQADAPTCTGDYGGTFGKIPTCTALATESHDWSTPTSNESTGDVCPTDGKVRITAHLRGLDAWNGKTAHVIAGQGFDQRRFSAVRPVSSGAVEATCATALGDSAVTRSSPSAAMYIDVNADGRCDAGDVGVKTSRYAVSADAPRLFDGEGAFPVEQLQEGNNWTFCEHYFP